MIIVAKCNGLWIKIILNIIFWDVFSSLIRDRTTCVENCHQYWNVIDACSVIYTETNSSRQKSQRGSLNICKRKVPIGKVKITE